MSSNLEECSQLVAQTKKADYLKSHNKNTKAIAENALEIFNESGFTPPDLRKLTQAISTFHECDADCLQTRKEKNLKELWEEADIQEELAKIKAIITARNYFRSKDNGLLTLFNNDYVTPNISRELEEIKNIILNKQTNLLNVFKTMHSSYQTEYSSLKQINNLVELKEKELFDIIKKINEYEKLVNVDIRKNFYEFNDQKFYDNIKFYVQILYFSLIVVYIFFGDFISNKRYEDYRFYIGLLIYILIPFVIKYIVAFIVYLYTFALEYFNLKDPIYSYSDIMRADNIDKIYTSPVPNNFEEEQETAYLYNKYVK